MPHPYHLVPEEIRAEETRIVGDTRASVDFAKVDPATDYPKEAPVAQHSIELLSEAGDCPPRIIHSAGASNGRIYAAAGGVPVLMSNPSRMRSPPRRRVGGDRISRAPLLPVGSRRRIDGPIRVAQGVTKERSNDWRTLAQ